MVTVHKAVACVVQDGAILCFSHPSAGFQLPKGTVLPGEDLVHAVRRELAEESGIQFDGPMEPLAEFERIVGAGPSEAGPPENHIWHLFLIRTGGLASRWSHIASGSPEEEGLVFDFFWHALDEEPRGFADPFARSISLVATHVCSK